RRAAGRRTTAPHHRMDELAATLPQRAGNRTPALRLNQASRWFPPPILWLALGIAALAYRRLRGSAALWIPAVSGLLVVVFAALGLPAEPHYAVPVAPAFVVLAGAGLFAPRRELAPVAAWRTALPRLASGLMPLAGTPAGGVVGAR